MLHILDSEVRLITPTDSEGTMNGGRSSAAGRPTGTSRIRHSRAPLAFAAQVLPAHARLPGPVAAGLADPEATRDAAGAGRAAPGRSDRVVERPAGEPLLTCLVAVAGPPPAHASADWTTAERTMMRRAARHHAASVLLLSVGLALLLLIGREGFGRQRARGLQDRLLQAATEDVPDIVREMGPFRRWLDAPLRAAYVHALAKHDIRRQLHASLGLLPVDRGQVSYLRDRLLSALPQELIVIREAVQPHAAKVGPWLWEVALDAKRLPGERLRAACALATYAPDDARWQSVSRDVAARLVAENGLVIALGGGPATRAPAPAAAPGRASDRGRA